MLPNQLRSRLFCSSPPPLTLTSIDHVCLSVTDLPLSINWYRRVLNFKHIHQDQPHFYPTCTLGSPAFLTSSSINLALLPVSLSSRIPNHNGAHLAFTLPPSLFTFAKTTLPALLAEHKPAAHHDVSVDFQDYGIQHSLFFRDPDDNILELTCWTNEPSTN